MFATVGLLFSPVAIANSDDLNSKSIPIFVPKPYRYSPSPQEKAGTNQAIPIQVPKPENQAVPARLMVPDVPIPKGNLTIVNPNFEIEEKEVLYRVIVKSRDKELVRSLYPDAFTIVYLGQSVLQAGLFRDRSNAIDARESLKNLGLDAAIVE